MEELVCVDGEGEIVVEEGGFDDGVDGHGGNGAVGFL